MSTAEEHPIQFATRSHAGMSGKNNEDRFAVSVYQIAGDPPIPALFAVVCDGIGGHRAGEVAAEMAVEAITRSVIAGDPTQPLQTLSNSIIHAGQTIYEQSENDADQRGMGATCACAWIIGSQLYTACVGDSRIYLLRQGSIQQITIDHTWIQEAIDNGLLTPEQARGHPNSHVIRRYLGSRQPVVPDFRLRLRPEDNNSQAEANQGLQLEAGDQILLCSDGLTDLVNESEILEVLHNFEQEQALDKLVKLANQRGGHDNITAVSLQIPGGITVLDTAERTQSIRVNPSATQPTPVTQTAVPAAASAPALQGAASTLPAATSVPKPKKRSFVWTCAGIGMLLVIGTLALAGTYWWLSGENPIVLPGLSQTAEVTAESQTPTKPALFSTPTRRLIATATPFRSATVTPPRTTASSPTAPAATLTPWPTNTTAP